MVYPRVLNPYKYKLNTNQSTNFDKYPKNVHHSLLNNKEVLFEK